MQRNFLTGNNVKAEGLISQCYLH